MLVLSIRLSLTQCQGSPIVRLGQSTICLGYLELLVPMNIFQFAIGLLQLVLELTKLFLTLF